MNVKETVSDMAIKASPPTTVSVATWVGIHLPDIVQAMTFVYLAVLITYKCWHWYREYKGYKINKEDRDDDYEL
jgi:hypothetical protein